MTLKMYTPIANCILLVDCYTPYKQSIIKESSLLFSHYDADGLLKTAEKFYVHYNITK